MKVMKYFFTIIGILVLFAFTGTSVAQDDYLPFAEVMPSPVGGMPAIYKHIQYPEMAKKSGVQGKVYVLAYIDQTGKVTQVKVLKGIGAGCDEAAVKGVQETKFTPGENKGAPVKVKLSLQINFALSQ